MMSNLFAMRAVPSSTDMKQWQKEYLQGTGCEMYTETLSSSFIGMTFSQAAETCFVKVNPARLRTGILTAVLFSCDSSSWQ